MQEALSSPVLHTPPVAPAGSEFDFSGQSLTSDVTAMNGSPDSPFAADPGMPTGPVNTVDTAPPEPTTPDAPPTSNPSRHNPTPTDGGRSRSRRRPTPDAGPTAPNTGSNPPTPPEPPTAPPSAGEAGRSKRLPRLRRLGTSALIGAGTYAALRSGIFDSIHDRLDSSVGENASEVADVVVISSVLAVTSLRSQVANVRKNRTARQLAETKTGVARQIVEYENIKRSVETLSGRESTTFDPEPGTILSRSHQKKARRAVNVRDKASAEAHEISGIKRHLGRQQQDTVQHEIYPGVFVELTTTSPGLDAEDYQEDIDALPRTKKAHKLYHKAAEEYHEVEEETEEMKHEAMEAALDSDRWALQKLVNKQDKLETRLDTRTKSIANIAKRKESRSRTYVKARKAVAKGARAAARTVRNDVRSYRQRIRR